MCQMIVCFFFFNDTATTEIYTLSLHDALPISYILDGKEVNPKDVVGKSGKLKIKLQIINKDSHKVTVKGKEKTIYTPFAAASIINLPLEKFTNLKVNTGEVMADGNNQVVTFISLPGMKESLGLDDKNEIGRASCR